ncbi:helix-turn-helix domain-containing protein [uncultured Alistipes sp.]|jgi:transposase|uniref:helix-turn-helix domain-containing protein n=1 Tax=uncultured Alistipes sp. TaxID=538949 RepID=UPI0025D76BE2|nr:helix-turn-helix domain-containing protein [uncultured Alistipes sp.]
MAITLEPKKGGRPAKRPKGEAEMRELAELYQTHTATELAEKYGVKPATIRAWVSRMRKEGVSLNG